jgi:hypothetical protein
MGGAKRRSRIDLSKPGEIKASADELYAEVAAFLIEGVRDRTIFFGPVVWLLSDGTAARRWRFVVVTGGRRGETQHNELGAEDRRLARRRDGGAHRA